MESYPFPVHTMQSELTKEMLREMAANTQTPEILGFFVHCEHNTNLFKPIVHFRNRSVPPGQDLQRKAARWFYEMAETALARGDERAIQVIPYRLKDGLIAVMLPVLIRSKGAVTHVILALDKFGDMKEAQDRRDQIAREAERLMSRIRE